MGAASPGYRQSASTGCGQASTPQTRRKELLGFFSEASVACLPLPTIRRSCLDDDGQTPLHMASAAGHLDAVKGTLHVTCACMHVHAPTYALHLDAGKGLLLTTHGLLLTTYYSLLTTYYLLLDSVKGLTRGECPELTVLDKYRMTPFHLACEGGYTETVQYLVSHCKVHRDMRRGSAPPAPSQKLAAGRRVTRNCLPE